MEDLFYELRIHTDELNYDSVSAILELHPDNLDAGWAIKTTFEEGGGFSIVANQYLDQLEGNFNQLREINIDAKDITIWIIYGYENQCNMEFDPQIIKRLGNLDIRLCISCYQVGD